MKKLKSILAAVMTVCICFGVTGCGNSKSKDLDDMTESDIEEALEALDEDDDDYYSEESSAVDTEEFDPFDYLTVKYDGISPMGTVSYDVDESGIPTTAVTFKADKTSELSNGDTVTITATCTSNGYSLSEETHEYTVEGLNSYATALDDIPDDMKEKMLKQANDSITASWASAAEGNSLKSLDFLGYYFLTGKEGFSPSPYNQIYCVYKVTSNITGVRKEDESNTEECGEEVYYTFYSYSDIMILNDGTCSVDLSSGSGSSNEIKTEHGYWSFGYFERYTLMGYNDLDSMFNNCVTYYLSDYDYENTVQE